MGSLLSSLLKKLYKSSFLPGLKKRIEQQSAQRPQSFFFQKTKNTDHRVDISSPLRPPGSLRFTILFFLSSADKDKKMTEEEAERAEIISRKAFGTFDLPGSVENGAAFPHESRS
jgi:hypothetical protein